MRLDTAKHQLALQLLFGAAIGLLGSILLFKDWLIAGAPNNLLWGNDLDPNLMHWIASWGYHILVERADPLNFWNANDFYPNPGSLAYSDSMLTLQLFYAPLRLLGTSSLTALYLALAATSVLGAMLTFRALGEIGGFTWVEMGLITFGAHFSLSVVNYLHHYQLFGFQFAPATLLYVYLYLRDFRWRHLFAACALFALGVCFAGYFAPMVATVGLFASLYMIVVQIRRYSLRNMLSRIGVAGVLSIVVSTAFVYAIQLHPYIELNRGAPMQAPETTAMFSAGVKALFASITDVSMWYRPLDGEFGRWEYAYFPGVILLVAGIAFTGAMIASMLRPTATASRDAENTMAPPQLSIFMFIVFVVSIVLSLGPLLKPAPSIRLPFYYLSHVIPGLGSVRAPGRFGIFIGLALAVMLVDLMRRWLPDARRHAVMPLVVVLVLIEALPRHQLFPFRIDPDGAHARIAQVVNEGDSLLMLPALGAEPMHTIRIAMAQMNGSTLHWARLVVGYGARNSAQYDELLTIDDAIQSHGAPAEAMLDFARRYRIQYFFLDKKRYAEGVAKRLADVFRANAATVIEDDDETLFVMLEE
jgi:hypothetical protein